jgi:hypothetical protein
VLASDEQEALRGRSRVTLAVTSLRKRITITNQSVVSLLLYIKAHINQCPIGQVFNL